MRGFTVGATIEIIESETTLLIKATRKHSIMQGAATVLVCVACAVIFLQSHVGTLLLIPIAALVAGIALLQVTRTRIAEVRVTDLGLECSSQGYFEAGSRRDVPRSEIQHLEYREGSGGPETSYDPGGLYAASKPQSICLLPYIDEQQALEIVRRIEAKFPDFGKAPSEPSPFGRHFVQLGVADPKGKME